MVSVSVIMPSYNHEKYISIAIDSVLNQSFKDLELIIIDDCSKDSSREILGTYRKMDNRVKVQFHDRNMGMANTLNDCLSRAQGKYVAFIDSDDIWLESKLEKQLSIINNDGSLIVWSEGEVIDEKGIPIGTTFTQLNFASNHKKSGLIFDDLLDRNYIFKSSLLLKREYASKFSFDAKLKYLNDYKFVLNLANEHAFFYFKEPLTKYRVHGRNTILEWENPDWAKDRVSVYSFLLRMYGGRIQKRKKAFLLSEIGKQYLILNKDSLAKFYFLKAAKVHPFSKPGILNIIFFLTDGKGKAGNIFLSLSNKIGSLIL